MRPHFAKRKKLLTKAITVIEALSAKKTGEADHLLRLRAVERCCDMLEAGTGQAAGY